jgi:glyoxylase-like metal-dependent hydrolase (beta-lactamase superfamily II)
VLLTHPDADHLGGTAELLAARPGATVLAGAGDLALVGDPERLIAGRGARFSTRDDVPFDEPALARARARAGAPFTGAGAAPPALELGGRRVELVPTPGHSPGHTAAWVADEGLLAAGDAVMGDGIPRRDGSLLIPPMYEPPAVYAATIERVRALAPRLLVTGHEPILRGPAIEAFLERSEVASARLGELVAAALDEQPRTLLELCRRVHEGYGGLPPDRVGDLALTVDGHLGELLAAGRVAVEEGPPRRFRSTA